MIAGVSLTRTLTLGHVSNYYPARIDPRRRVCGVSRTRTRHGKAGTVEVVYIYIYIYKYVTKYIDKYRHTNIN